MGVEPTASLVLSESGLPVAYRAIRRNRLIKEQKAPVPGVGVEPTRAGSKPASLPLADPGVFQESGIKSQESEADFRLTPDS